LSAPHRGVAITTVALNCVVVQQSRLCVSHNHPAFARFVGDHPDALIGFAALQKSGHLPLLTEADLEQQNASRPQISRRVSRNPHMDAESVGTGCECLAGFSLEQGGTVAFEPRL
jgi:hypothetical protein